MNLMSKDYLLFCVIIDFGKASKVLKEAKKLGATGGTIILGKGTAKNHLLELLGLNEIRKEILLMAIESSMDTTIHNELSKLFLFNKPNNGIVFSLPLKSCFGISDINYINGEESEGDNNMGYEAIFTIVDKGFSQEVLLAAESVGSTGGTIIHGRGSGTSAVQKIFNLEIEPEKDIVLILSNKDNSENISNAIRKILDEKNEGKGIVFSLDVGKTSGLYENK